MPDAFSVIEDACRQANIRAGRIAAGEGEILATIDNARILGCRLGETDNLFYSPAGTITGGDRLWIAPEVAYFWPSLDQAREDPVKHAAIPEQIDPGGYALDQEEGDWARGIRMSTRMQMMDGRVHKRLALHVERWFEPIAPPAIDLAGLALASFGITNRLTLLDGDPDAVAGAWDILQVPRGGTMICPVFERVEPTSYYDDFDERQVRCDHEAVRFRIDGSRRIKVGLAPAATTGAMGYYRELEDGRASLIVRLFVPQPQQEYVDVPRSADVSTRIGGDGAQVYGDDDTFGPFGEMEHHDPAIIVAQSPGVREGKSATHALVGPADAVRRVGEELLGVPVGMMK